MSSQARKGSVTGGPEPSGPGVVSVVWCLTLPSPGIFRVTVRDRLLLSFGRLNVLVRCT